MSATEVRSEPGNPGAPRMHGSGPHAGQAHTHLRPRRWPKHSAALRWSLLALVLAVLVAWPLIKLESSVLDDTGNVVSRVLETPGIGQVMLNTVSLALGSVVVAVLCGTGLAWCVYRSPAKFRNWLTILPIIPLMVPAVASITGYVYLLSPRVGLVNVWLRDIGLGSGPSGPVDIYSMPGIIFITGFSLTSFVYLFVNASLQQRGAELEMAASTCGASPTRIFLSVTLPLLRPAVVYSSGLTFLLGIGQFAAPLLLGAPNNIDVVTTVIYKASQTYPIDYGFGAVLGTPLILAGVVIVILQRWSLRDERKFVSVSGKGKYASQQTTGWAVVPVLLYIVISVALPISALLVTSLSPFWSGKVNPSTFTTRAFDAAFSNPSTINAITTSLIAAGITLLIALPIGFLSALALLKRTGVPAPIRWTIDVLSSVSLGMPAALFGFALLFTYTGPPFNLYGTSAIIIVAYVTLMIPQAVRPQLSALLATSNEYSEASLVSGAGTIRTTLRVTLPMVRTGVGVAAAMIVVLVFHEFAASVLVRSPQTQVMGTLLFDQWTSGTAPGVAVVALIMIAVTVVGVLLALAIGGKRALENI
jgi:iron(III) transport system permease protein